jgi:anaphase-promoting complex subunit 1
MTLSLHAISKRSVAELAGQATVEQTLCILVLSLGIVMAGTGDLEVVRLIRFLGSRVGPKFPTVTYGSHMALHMAMGLLFLGGGRFNLSTEPRAVAAMVCAFFPKFPTHSLDNRFVQENKLNTCFAIYLYKCLHPKI